MPHAFRISDGGGADRRRRHGADLFVRGQSALAATFPHERALRQRARGPTAVLQIHPAVLRTLHQDDGVQRGRVGRRPSCRRRR